jgi:hypothetical protein
MERLFCQELRELLADLRRGCPDLAAVLDTALAGELARRVELVHEDPPRDEYAARVAAANAAMAAGHFLAAMCRDAATRPRLLRALLPHLRAAEKADPVVRVSLGLARPALYREYEMRECPVIGPEPADEFFEAHGRELVAAAVAAEDLRAFTWLRARLADARFREAHEAYTFAAARGRLDMLEHLRAHGALATRDPRGVLGGEAPRRYSYYYAAGYCGQAAALDLLLDREGSAAPDVKMAVAGLRAGATPGAEERARALESAYGVVLDSTWTYWVYFNNPRWMRDLENIARRG